MTNRPQIPHASWNVPRWLVLALLVLSSTSFAWAQPAPRDPNRISTVVLDAGHGGKDPGNLGTRTMKKTEKDVTLAVTLLVGRYIKEAFPDIKVMYTREKDEFIGLKERTEIANKAGADLFISIHCNSNERPDPVGADTYVMGLHKTEANLRTAQKENAAILLEEGHELTYDGFNPNEPESMIAISLRQNAYLEQSLMFASLVQDQIRERVGRVDRGVKQAGFWVISFTTMPSALIELGFLTNPKEEQFLQSDQGQEYMASAIYRAFKDYRAQIESVDVTMGTTAQTTVHDGVRFAVQIVTSRKPIDLDAKNFNGMENVSEYQSAGLFKYTVGEEHSLEDARRIQRTCRDKGYEGAFIVAFRDGDRIDLQEAVKLAGNR